jgi:hypothetical protein
LTGEEFERIKRLGGFAMTLQVDATFLDIVKGLKEDAIRDWTFSKSPDEREIAYRDLQAVGRLQAKLKTLADNYTAEVTRLESEKKQIERMRRQREAAERA